MTAMLIRMALVLAALLLRRARVCEVPARGRRIRSVCRSAHRSGPRLSDFLCRGAGRSDHDPQRTDRVVQGPNAARQRGLGARLADVEHARSRRSDRSTFRCTALTSSASGAGYSDSVRATSMARACLSASATFALTPNIAAEFVASQVLGDYSDGYMGTASIVMSPFPEWRVSPFFEIGTRHDQRESANDDRAVAGSHR